MSTNTTLTIRLSSIPNHPTVPKVKIIATQAQASGMKTVFQDLKIAKSKTTTKVDASARFNATSFVSVFAKK